MSGLIRHEDLHGSLQNELYRPNILINGDFKIWQRGIEFDGANGVYTADRWAIVNNVDTNVSVYKTSGGKLRIECYGGAGEFGAYSDLFQKIEDYAYYGGKTITISMDVTVDEGATAVMYVYDGYANYISPDTIDHSGVYTFTCTVSQSLNALQAALRFFRSGLTIGKGIVINWVKMEVNNHATPFIPRSYAEELRDCLRYYYKPGAVRANRMYYYSTNTMVFNFPLPVPMRANPTLVGVFETDYYVQTMTGDKVAGFNFNLVHAHSSLNITATKAGHGQTDGAFVLRTDAGFDAEL